MGVSEVFWAIVGFLVISFVLFGVALLASEVLRSLGGAWTRASEQRAHEREAAKAGRADEEEARLRAAEDAELAKGRLVAEYDGPSEALHAAVGGVLLVTGHRDGNVRLRDLSRGDGRAAGGFSAGYEGAVGPLAVSRDGAMIATSQAYRCRLEVRRPDGTPVGSIGPDGEAARAWHAGANDADGYLIPNEHLEAFAFCGDGDHGLTLVAAWDLLYGPDGFPGPTFGSHALLVRLFRVPEGGPPELIAESVQDDSCRYVPGRWVTIAPDGTVVFGRGRAWIFDPASGETRGLRDEVGRPLAYAPDGRTILGALPGDGDPAGLAGAWKKLALWDPDSGERIRLIEDSAATTFTERAALSPDGTTIAITAREWRPAPEHPTREGFGYDRVRLYDVRTGELLKKLPAAATLLAFAPDGEALFTVEPEGTKIWRVQGDE